MIIGTGLIAGVCSASTRALRRVRHAAGVSTLPVLTRESSRGARVEDALTATPINGLFVYFSTCSVGDPAAQIPTCPNLRWSTSFDNASAICRAPATVGREHKSAHPVESPVHTNRSFRALRDLARRSTTSSTSTIAAS